MQAQNTRWTSTADSTAVALKVFSCRCADAQFFFCRSVRPCDSCRPTTVHTRSVLDQKNASLNHRRCGNVQQFRHLNSRIHASSPVTMISRRRTHFTRRCLAAWNERPWNPHRVIMASKSDSQHAVSWRSAFERSEKNENRNRMHISAHVK